MTRITIITTAVAQANTRSSSEAMAQNKTRAVTLTAKSLAAQQDAPPVEWVVVHTPDTDLSQAAEHFPITHAIAQTGSFAEQANAGLARATYDYVLFLPAGDALSDAHVLRNMIREALRNIRADMVYGMVRGGGFIRRLQSPHRITRQMITPLQACVLRRSKIAALRFDTDETDATTAAYIFMLHLCAVTDRIEPIPHLWIDVADAPQQLSLKTYYHIWRDVLALPLPIRILLMTRAVMLRVLQRIFPHGYQAILTAPKHVQYQTIPPLAYRHLLHGKK